MSYIQVISLLDPTKEEIMKSIELFCKMLETPTDKGTALHNGMYGMHFWHCLVKMIEQSSHFDTLLLYKW